MMKDDEFITKLLENMEGIMLWALEGASLYIDNPRMEAPKAMSSAKDKAVNEGDVLGIWIRGNIRKAKTNLKFKRVKELLNTQNEHLGQRQAGFNKQLKAKLEMLGYEVGGREDKGDLYIKCAEERPEDESEEEEEEAEEEEEEVVEEAKEKAEAPMMGQEPPKKTLREKLKEACAIWNPKK
jgi:hypothetical protein